MKYIYKGLHHLGHVRIEKPAREIEDRGATSATAIIAGCRGVASLALLEGGYIFLGGGEQDPQISSVVATLY